MIIIIIMIRMSRYRIRVVKVDPGSRPSLLCNSLCGKHLNGGENRKSIVIFLPGASTEDMI